MSDVRCRHVVEGEPGRYWVFAECGGRWQIVSRSYRPFATAEEAEAEARHQDALDAWRAGGGWGPEPKRPG